MEENEINEVNNEELDSNENIVVLTDDTGKEIEFEFIDLIEMDDNEYVVLLPLEQTEEEEGEVVILKVDVQGEEETYVSIDSEEEANKVFEMFKEKFKDEFQFEN